MSEATQDRAAWLRRDAERISGTLPPLLVEAQRLAQSMIQGVHGRRQAGPGETFWQYRPAHPGDSLTQIDWRRSARSDRLFLRQLEWEAAETVLLWADRSAAMDYRSRTAPRSKAERACLLALALSVLLNRGAERFGLAGTEAERPAGGETQLLRIASILSTPLAEKPEYGAAPRIAVPKAGKAVFLSDFMGPEEDVLPALLEAAGHGIAGAFVQILDPAEEDFPFAGRTRFQSMGRTLSHDTDEARGLSEGYRKRLAARRDRLATVARRAGWQLILHSTAESPRRALIRLHATLGGA